MKTHHFFFFLLLQILPHFLSTLAVQYEVIDAAPNTLGGSRFEAEIGVPFTIDLMGTITKFIWKTFNQTSDAQRKNVPVVNLYITELNDGDAMAETSGNNIYVSRNLAIESFPIGGAREGLTWLLYHEMTHVFQWSGEGTAPGGLTEGIADYVMIESGSSDVDTRTGEGGSWDEGYGVTARFLQYCDSLREGFTVALNNMMREVYKDEYFEELLGKPLDQVWREYKAKYGNIPANTASEVFTDRVKY